MKRDVRLAVVTSLAPRSGLVLGRFILGLVVSVCVVFPTTTVAAKGSGGHGSSGRASVTNGGASKTVHVGPYTRKDGTHVNAYDRREPGSTSDRPTSLADLAQTTAARRAGAANQNRLQMRPSLADLASVQANRNAMAAQPGTLTNSTPRASGAVIRIVTDPLTGQKTITNNPAAPLAASPKQTSPSLLAHPSLPTGLISPPSVDVARDERGRIQRSAAARHAFARQTGYPSGRPGYVIDHIKPLACGGADAPSNMQWQTIREGKAKDQWERAGCK